MRRVMRFQRAGSARRAVIRQQWPDAQYFSYLGRADTTGTQQHGLAARHIDDRRFDADLALAAIEDACKQTVPFRAEFVAHVLRSRRADVAEFVGGGCRDTALAVFESTQ